MEVKEHILSEIYQNNYYVDYCVEDPMEELVAAICSTREEQLKRADLMMQIDDDEIKKKRRNCIVNLAIWNIAQDIMRAIRAKKRTICDPDRVL
ncbi:MAG: hypothetical protein ACLVJX_10595 [Merdibacter sp.]